MTDKPSLTLIRSFLHKNGRLLWGTVFFICLVGGYGYYQGYWGFIEQSDNMQQGDFAPAKDKIKLEENRNSDRETVTSSKETSNGNMKLRMSVAAVERGLPLRDPFIRSYTLADAEKVLAEKDGHSNKEKINDSDKSTIYKTRVKRKFDGAVLNHSNIPDTGATSSISVHIRGVIMGNTPQVILSIGSKEGTYSIGEQIHEENQVYTVLDINSNGVYLSQEGTSKWYGIE